MLIPFFPSNEKENMDISKSIICLALLALASPRSIMDDDYQNFAVGLKGRSAEGVLQEEEELSRGGVLHMEEDQGLGLGNSELVPIELA